MCESSFSSDFCKRDFEIHFKFFHQKFDHRFRPERVTQSRRMNAVAEKSFDDCAGFVVIKNIFKLLDENFGVFVMQPEIRQRTNFKVAGKAVKSMTRGVLASKIFACGYFSRKISTSSVIPFRQRFGLLTLNVSLPPSATTMKSIAASGRFGNESLQEFRRP